MVEAVAGADGPAKSLLPTGFEGGRVGQAARCPFRAAPAGLRGPAAPGGRARPVRPGTTLFFCPRGPGSQFACETAAGDGGRRIVTHTTLPAGVGTQPQADANASITSSPRPAGTYGSSSPRRNGIAGEPSSRVRCRCRVRSDRVSTDG